MNNDNNCIKCTTCGRPWAINTCPKRCSCGAYFNEYKYTRPGCVRNQNRDCAARAVIASKTVATTKEMLGLCEALVHVAENNTTYYLDDKGNKMLTWAGPVELEGYDIVANPLGLKGQLLYTTEETTDPVTGEKVTRSVTVYYDNKGNHHTVYFQEDIVEIEELITEESQKLEEKIDQKQDILTAGENITIEYDAATKETTISATGGGGGGEYIAGQNITIENNIISAKDTTYTAGTNISITDQNVINAIVNLSNYYNKSEVDSMIAGVTGLTMEIVTTLPATGDSGTIYLIQRAGEDVYDQWIYTNGAWTNIGNTGVDLSAYYTKAEADNLLDDKQDTIVDSGLQTSVIDTTRISAVYLDRDPPISVYYPAESVYEYIEQKIIDRWEQAYLDKIYPVGSIYISVDNTNPGTRFGGTWTIVARNRALWGVSSNTEAGQNLDESLPAHHHQAPMNVAEELVSVAAGTDISGVWRGINPDPVYNITAGTFIDGGNFNPGPYSQYGEVRPNAYTVYFWQRMS